MAELGLLAAAEAAATGLPLSEECWQRLCAMIDSAAALLDERLAPPRQGDGDEGRAILLDTPAQNPWPGLLSVGAALFSPLNWWPTQCLRWQARSSPRCQVRSGRWGVGQQGHRGGSVTPG